MFILAYSLGNFVGRLTLPESVKHWSLTSVQTRLIKIGGRLVFQLSEVLETRGMLPEIRERISRLRQQWTDQHGGVANTYQLAILERGAWREPIRVPLRARSCGSFRRAASKNTLRTLNLWWSNTIIRHLRPWNGFPTNTISRE